MLLNQQLLHCIHLSLSTFPDHFHLHGVPSILLDCTAQRTTPTHVVVLVPRHALRKPLCLPDIGLA